MPGLNIIVLTPDAERFRGALTVAAAAAAMGESAALFLQLDAVRLLGLEAPRDGEHRRAGLPTLAELRDDARALGVRLFACQTGLALAEMDATALPDGVEASGPLAFLAASKEGRLVLV